MKNILTLFIFFTICTQLVGCSNNDIPHHGPPNNQALAPTDTPDVVADLKDLPLIDVAEDIYSIFTDPCIECAWYFCPPLDAIWQKQICINKCQDPPTVVLESECIEYLECDPSQYIMSAGLVCETIDGYPGTQDKVCNKGQIKYTDCITACVDEICNGVDDDCDQLIDEGFDLILELCNNIDDNCNGIVDEGEWECDKGCGPGPNLCVAGELICMALEPGEEICDGKDNDCDGSIDEDQLNACGQCGILPPESCNGIDDDCNGLIDEELMQPCGTACGEGYEICNGGAWISCNAPLAMIEICDGLDNDCDGQIDEGLECICTIQDVGAFFPCQENPLLCGQGYKTCECIDPTCETIVTTSCYAICHWMVDPPGSDPACDSFVGMPITNEDCNNFDDDCDQLIDEDLTSGCYTGEAGTMYIGVCIPGEMVCEGGAWGNINETSLNFVPGYCKDEIVPQEEVCNGIDDDCNGETDWGEKLQNTDILFIVDWSGSMSQELNAVLIALNQFAATYSDETVLQWGTILGPRTNGAWLEYLELYHDLSGFSNFLTLMSSLNSNTMGGGHEMLLDAIFLSLQNISGTFPKLPADMEWATSVDESIPYHDDFLVGWRANSAKIIILFSDEKPQSYLVDDAGPLSSSDVTLTILGTPQLKFYAFSISKTWGWDEMAIDSGGKYFELTSSPASMYSSLMEILDDICSGAGAESE